MAEAKERQLARLKQNQGQGQDPKAVRQNSAPRPDKDARKTTAKRGKTANVSRDSVSKADKLKKTAPTIFEQVKAGRITLNAGGRFLPPASEIARKYGHKHANSVSNLPHLLLDSLLHGHVEYRGVNRHADC